MKECCKCNVNKPLNCFYKFKHNKTGYKPRCKVCQKEDHKEYCIKNKDKINQNQIQYRKENKGKIKEYQKENKGKIKEYQKEYGKEYREKNKDKITERSKKYETENKDKKKEYILKNNKKTKEYQKKYREKNKKYFREYYRKRSETHPLHKLASTLRSRTRYALKAKGLTKTSKTEEMLGCSFAKVKTHLQINFTKGMNWSNHGEWHIDHIIPLASAKNKTELIKLCNYKNLQPLWAFDNLSKGSKITTIKNIQP